MGTIQIAAKKPARAAKAEKPVAAIPVIRDAGTDKVGFILTRAETFAASYGLRPYRILVIKDTESKEKLRSAGWNPELLKGQAQLVVFAIEKEISKERIDSYIADIAGRKKVSAYTFLSYKKYLESHINHPGKDGRNWAAKQAVLAVSNLQAVAALTDVKSNVIEGPGAAALDRLLDLEARDLTASIAVVLS